MLTTMKVLQKIMAQIPEELEDKGVDPHRYPVLFNDSHENEPGDFHVKIGEIHEGNEYSLFFDGNGRLIAIYQNYWNCNGMWSEKRYHRTEFVDGQDRLVM
jgi:hypothetical protein